MMNRHERRSLNSTEQRRERTPAELDTYVARLLREWGEQLGFLAWNGYQRLGRGAVMVTEEHGSIFCSRADLHKFPIRNLPPILSMTETYDPTEQVIVVALLPETKQFYEHVRAFVFSPQVAPPLAKADPMVIVTKDEPRH